MKSNSKSCTSAYARRRRWSERNGQGQCFCPHPFHSAGGARTALGVDQCPAHQSHRSGSRNPARMRVGKAFVLGMEEGKPGAKAGAREPAPAKLASTSQLGTSLDSRSSRWLGNRRGAQAVQCVCYPRRLSWKQALPSGGTHMATRGLKLTLCLAGRAAMSINRIDSDLFAKD